MIEAKRSGHTIYIAKGAMEMEKQTNFTNSNKATSRW
jgi:hypothetical protein